MLCNRHFLADAAIYGLAGFLLPAASFVLLPLYTHYLSPAEYGTMELIERLGGVVLLFLMMGGLTGATITFYCQAKSPGQRLEAVTSSVLLQFGLFSIGSLLGVAFAEPLGQFVGLDDPQLTRLGLIAVLATVVPYTPLALMRARGQSVRYLMTAAFLCGARITLSIFVLMVLDGGLRGLFCVWILVMGGTGLAICTAELLVKGFRFHARTLSDMLRFALPFLPLALCMFVVNCADRFFLAKHASLAELGRYALGYKLAGIAAIMSFDPLYQVWTARRMYDAFDSGNAASEVGRMFTRLLTCYLTMALLVSLFAQQAIELLARAEYRGAAVVVTPILLATFFRLFALLMDGALFVRRKTYLKAWIAVPSALLTLPLLAWSIPRWGILGAAYTTLLSYMLFAGAKLYVTQRVFSISYQYRALVCMIVFFCVFAVIPHQAPDGVCRIVATCLVCVTWFPVLWLGGVVDQEDKEVIRKLFGRFLALPTTHL